ncbi:hypothetical protein VOLCADRAFT_117870 [Volvox carteri f. nagariensis]|uniref:Heme oxygenase n=1 Tax=Volvox carteri f. nagariensis TaxID=3068 RepID=D8TYU6_VOLCA|nr:uncharacterized protein VOLCADRAFT_117870 [Volvox carteri f. nagariensis]EFJ47375.1 hypothetical protein VOLCADRAFT_117870 [Volvox carteri f. nagariensis]|eukprot:XP_002951564.1 hypothetical protein VOLCADRAFT_117870 [Volvox carteri f. nagariensis]
MYRTAGFRADLEYLLGPNWEACCGSKSPPLKEYEPRLLLAHSYTQHLAMAAGGQVIRRLVRKHLALTEEDAGTDAFEFKGESSNTLRTKFKATLDEWARGLPEEDVRQLISEHVTTFQFQNAIIRAFPIPTAAVVKGVLQLIPRPLLLAVLAVLAAALVLLVAPTVPWVAAAMGWQVLPDAAP